MGDGKDGTCGHVVRMVIVIVVTIAGSYRSIRNLLKNLGDKP